MPRASPSIQNACSLKEVQIVSLGLVMAEGSGVFVDGKEIVGLHSR